jgi:hypothetical protein
MEPEVLKAVDAPAKQQQQQPPVRKAVNFMAPSLLLCPDEDGWIEVTFPVTRVADTLLLGTVQLEFVDGICPKKAELAIGDARIEGELRSMTVGGAEKHFIKFWNGDQEFPVACCPANKPISIVVRADVRDAIRRIVGEIKGSETAEAMMRKLAGFLSVRKVALKYDGYQYEPEYRARILESYCRVNLPDGNFIQFNVSPAQ